VTTALVIGIDGQDGSYLAEYLLEQGYRVIGWTSASIPITLANLQTIRDRITLTSGELSDQASLLTCLDEYRPDQIYNFASPSFPASSWDSTVEVGDVTALGVARLLEALRLVCPQARFYQASSSELFGDPMEVPQCETTPFHPRNPYGIAKLYAHWLTVRYRERYGIFAVSGILYNHESPRRGKGFVTRKISLGAAMIKLGMATELHLGDLEARRDWGYAGDYVAAIWMMLQQTIPQDYVIGTGEPHSVREFCDIAFNRVGLDYHDYVVQDVSFIRSPETAQLVADSRRARHLLKWQPTIAFEELVNLMVDSDLQRLVDQRQGDNLPSIVD
jgi:GDPmannose 4,6-dehydratase